MELSNDNEINIGQNNQLLTNKNKIANGNSQRNENHNNNRKSNLSQDNIKMPKVALETEIEAEREANKILNEDENLIMNKFKNSKNCFFKK